ncbi:MAG: DUF4040 domain-containing protein [Candidatus Halichondribacter symbioticus]
MSTLYMNIVLFAMMIATAIAIVRMNKLFAVVMLSGVFSLLAAMLFIVLDAVDVAFTEAAVGAGISTVLMLGTIALIRDNENKTVRAGILPLIVVGITGLGMVYGTLDLPAFGAADAPAQMYLKPDYMARTVSEIDIPNVVTAILASYRGYDTMGEVVVVFTAGIAVLLLLSALQQRPAPATTPIKKPATQANWQNHLILRVVTKMLVGLIILYAFYVQFHGDFSPGGGFQAGIIIAVAFILYGLVFGQNAVYQTLSPWVVHKILALGVLIYIGTGLATMALGGAFLDYGVFAPHHPSHGQHWGILAVELGVGITVAGVMISIYYVFSARTGPLRDTDW